MTIGTTYAARMLRPGGPDVLVFEETSLSDPAPNEVRIAVAVAGVTYPDLLVRSGALPAAAALPHTLGFEVAGTVEAIGADVKGLAVGARVVAELHRGGGYATRANVDAANVIELEAETSFEHAVAIVISGRTALLMLRHSRLAAGETVFVPSALGGVGSFAVRLAKRLGAHVVAGVGGDDRVAAAGALGADRALSYARDGWSADVRADVVLQSTGGAVGRESLRALAPGGRLVMFGADNVVHPEPLVAEQVTNLLRQNQWLGGFSYLSTAPTARREAFVELERLLATGALAVSLTRFPLADAARAHAEIEARRAPGKTVLLCER